MLEQGWRNPSSQHNNALTARISDNTLFSPQVSFIYHKLQLQEVNPPGIGAKSMFTNPVANDILERLRIFLLSTEQHSDYSRHLKDKQQTLP